MEDKIREIVSVFIKVPAAQITDGTAIDRTALQSSILLHRMFARLGEEGVVINDYTGIKVFGDLLRQQGSEAGRGYSPDPVQTIQTGQALQTVQTVQTGQTGQTGQTVQALQAPLGRPSVQAPGIGIDIEEVAAMPRVADLRNEAFYTQNFTAAEIAYCILQADPYSSLTGLFAVKEAIVKADGQFRNRPFHSFGIGHSIEGKPEFPGFGLSISHAGGMAVAVAVRESGATARTENEMQVVAARKPASSLAWIAWMALLLAAAALLLALKH